MNVKTLQEAREGMANGLCGVILESVSKLGKRGTYVAGVLADNTGKIPFKVWNEGPVQEIMSAGKAVVICAGKVSVYMDEVQLTVDAANEMTLQRAEAEGIIPASHLSEEHLDTILEALVKFVESKAAPGSGLEHIRKVIESVREDGIWEKFVTYPAAMKKHQAYRRGLLEHSLSVARICHRVQDTFSMHPGYLNFDPALLVTGALFHDIGKVLEYSVSPVGLAKGVSLAGGLVGHLVMGGDYIFSKFREYNVDTAIRLQHIILAHHGRKEWDSPVEPATMEATMVHHADMIDSKFEPMTKPAGANMWIFTYGGSKYLNPGFGQDTDLV